MTQYVGAISGTSVDGLDLALVQVTGDGVTIPAGAVRAFPESLARNLRALAAPGPNEVFRVGVADAALGEFIGQAVLGFLAELDIAPEAVRATGHGDATWTSARRGLFAAGPHLLLEERFWDAPSRTATERWHVVHLDTARVERYAMSTCGYDARELVDLLAAVGFGQVRTHPSLTGDDGAAEPGLFGITAVR